MRERITEKTNGHWSYNIDQDFSEDDAGGYGINFGSHTLESAVEKLGKLEDFEDKFDFPLEILLKALTEGIYDKRRYYIGSCISLSNGNIGLYIGDLDRLFLFKDYGETWAATKEELE